MLLCGILRCIVLIVASESACRVLHRQRRNKDVG
jgi:hypothetical protein